MSGLITGDHICLLINKAVHCLDSTLCIDPTVSSFDRQTQCGRESEYCVIFTNRDLF